MSEKVYGFEGLFGGRKYFYPSREEAEKNASRYDPVPPVFEQDKPCFEVGKVYGVEVDYMDMPGSYWIRYLCVGRSAKFVSFQQVRHNGFDEKKFRVKLSDLYPCEEVVYPKNGWFSLHASQVVGGSE